jgi:rSAM/selenodomain-associated transferase 1
MPDNPLILLFIKAPLSGQVKSRLAAVLGQDAALELYQKFVLDILSSIEKSGVPCVVFHHSPDSGEIVKNWLGGRLPCLPQEGRDLGERMERAFRRAFSEGASRAVLVGSDIPDLPPELLNDALASLSENDAVIGPAKDGGYYLIGFRSETFFPDIFRGIEWSTDTVFSRTLQIFERAHQKVSLLPPWRDVDTIDDLKDLLNRNRNGGFSDSRTMNYLSLLKNKMSSAEVSDAKV